MTGPEHYREAERLLSAASYTRGPDGGPVHPEAAAHHLAMAQAHATLALAAVTAHHMVATSGNDRDEWSVAIHGSVEDYDIKDTLG